MAGSLNSTRSIFRAAAGDAVLRGAAERNPGPLKDRDVQTIFREIMSSCLALENPLKVAYLGPEGTFSQAAAMKHFGHAVISKPMAAIDEVFREVAAGADRRLHRAASVIPA